MLEPIFMLAIDHRWQWEEWCAANSVDATRIPAIKTLAADAFLRARDESDGIRRTGALLVDLTYGRDAFDAATAAGAFVGNPAERAGAFPLQWTAPFAEALPGRFAKVLVRHRSDVAAGIVDAQHRQLLELQQWCGAHGRPVVLEVLVAPAAGEEQDFDSGGRPRLLAEYIRRAYGRGIVPAYWKIEGMPDRASFMVVEEAIREAAGPRQLILGKGAGMDQVRQWFASAAGSESAAGFAIGRTVYFDAAAEWAAGRLAREDAIARVVANYRAVIDAWTNSR
jgi:5-dehydro-2-deoxygluconokinase